MAHDADKALLGATGSSAKDVSVHNSDPATYLAGLAVRLKSDQSLSVLVADGSWLGISLGRSLSDTKKTAVARTGTLIPILLTDDEADYAYVALGANVYIDDATGMANDETPEGETPAFESTLSNAIYVSGAIDGINEAGQLVKVALVDMVGGL